MRTPEWLDKAAAPPPPPPPPSLMEHEEEEEEEGIPSWASLGLSEIARNAFCKPSITNPTYNGPNLI